MWKKHEICPLGVAMVVFGAGLAQAGAADENTGGVRPSVNREAVPVCKPARDTDFAFTSNADGDSEIYLYDAKGASIHKLTDNDAQDHWATWSPDGQYLAFQSLRDGNREIYLLNLENGAVQNISNHPEQDLLPSWSPDGQYVAFFSSRELPWTGTGPIGGHIYLMQSDGSNITKLDTESFLSTSALAWSPDSATLYFARFADDKQGIYAFNLEDQAEALLHGIDGQFPGIASVRPASGTVDYYADNAAGADIYQLKVRDGVKTRLTAGAGYHYYASWSPDRSVLLTSSAQDDDGRAYDIRCVATDGTYDVPIIDDQSDARAAAWRTKGE